MSVFFMFFIFLFGLIIGSFLNALIWRIRTGDSLRGRSKCPKCGKQIAWYDNIPVISFLILGGKCRHCHKPISWQYPIVELVTAVLFAYAFYLNFSALGGQFLILKFFRDLFLISVMMIIFVYDLRWYLILDKITIPSMIILATLNLILGMTWQNLLLSSIIGGSFFLVQFIISRGKWIGGGDIRLGILMGVAMGWPRVLVAIFIAYILGSIVGLGLIFFGKKQWGSKVPFGTFLSVATVITLFWGMTIADWYLSLFRL